MGINPRTGHRVAVICHHCAAKPQYLDVTSDVPTMTGCGECDHRGYTFHDSRTCVCSVCQEARVVNSAVVFQPQSQVEGTKVIDPWYQRHPEVPTGWAREWDAVPDRMAEFDNYRYGNPSHELEPTRQPKGLVKAAALAGTRAFIATLVILVGPTLLLGPGLLLGANLLVYLVIAGGIAAIMAGLRGMMYVEPPPPSEPPEETLEEMRERHAIDSAESWALSKARRGQQRYPTLWGCTGCGYTYYSHGEEQDPEGDNHCSKGVWLADQRVINEIISNPFKNDE